MQSSSSFEARSGRLGKGAATAIALGTVLALGACDNLLEVEYPGRIPSGQIDNAALANVLARSVISDLECAYSNHSAGSSFHSDEWETANSNVPLANWGERTIGADEDNYVVSSCDDGGFGMQLTLQTARFQSEDIYRRLEAWSDTDVPNRRSLMAQVRAFGGYAYQFMGETWCQVAFDGAAAQAPAAALTLAEQRFTEAITIAQQAGNTDIVNMSRVGLARAKLMLKKYGEAATIAQQVPAGYVKDADRGAENTRRWNDIYRNGNDLGAYTVALSYRNTGDPRLQVVDANRGAFNPTIALWVSNKYTALQTPIRLASYREAQLIRAEALAEQNQVSAAMTILNDRRAEVSLAPLSASTQAQAIAHVMNERKMELAFEGGHRLADLLRRQLPWKGANGSTQVSNPFTARPYGQTTCWPHPTKESNGA
ncbi:MAG: RagB/SusD family nutrient uptake outer membrane protein [Gemmatimonadales bacterium]|nr:RagB/SusD family nutrient uptake outer membrane protein [Gemmatimonadales bacterium]